MTDYQHPITPPPHLMNQWDQEAREEIRYHANECSFDRESLKLIKAARWGADQELEACSEWVHETFKEGFAWCSELRDLRRPKPPSLKEQALNVLKNADGADHPIPVLVLPGDEADIIRRALEALPDD